MTGGVSITDALSTALDVVKDGLEIFTQAPAIYFVALAMLGAGVGVARKFVPMRKR